MNPFFRKYINNKYFYTAFAFLVWMVFFDQESFIEQYRLSQTLRGLESQKEFYIEEIEKNEMTIDLLETDSSALEKFAREKYFMKKDNEEVFVIIDD
jgi:cell division protein FtsB